MLRPWSEECSRCRSSGSARTESVVPAACSAPSLAGCSVGWWFKKGRRRHRTCQRQSSIALFRHVVGADNHRCYAHSRYHASNSTRERSSRIPCPWKCASADNSLSADCSQYPGVHGFHRTGEQQDVARMDDMCPPVEVRALFDLHLKCAVPRRSHSRGTASQPRHGLPRAMGKLLSAAASLRPGKAR